MLKFLSAALRFFGPFGALSSGDALAASAPSPMADRSLGRCLGSRKATDSAGFRTRRSWSGREADDLGRSLLRRDVKPFAYREVTFTGGRSRGPRAPESRDIGPTETTFCASSARSWSSPREGRLSLGGSPSATFVLRISEPMLFYGVFPFGVA